MNEPDTARKEHRVNKPVRVKVKFGKDILKSETDPNGGTQKTRQKFIYEPNFEFENISKRFKQITFGQYLCDIVNYK